MFRPTSNCTALKLWTWTCPLLRLDIRTRVRGAKGTRSGGGGGHKAKCVVRVRVVDTNDLDPFFAPSRYTFVVEEDAPLHRSVGRVRAEDADEGVNGEIYYRLLGPTEGATFAVDPVTGELTLTRPLDFREKPTHDLVVAAADRGAKPDYANRQADTATVHIKVKQVRTRGGKDKVERNTIFSPIFNMVLVNPDSEVK